MKSVIIDYGAGNIHSIQHKLSKIGVNATISSSAMDIKDATFLVICGVGHFAKAMENLNQNDLFDVLNNKVMQDKTPILGICLGMQLFTQYSEEGNANGFGWLDAETQLFHFDKGNQKVPHIGWKTLNPVKNSPIIAGVELKQRFYFIHSYHVVCNNTEDILTTTHYNGIDFTSTVWKDNIFGTQFHPEKSHRRGMNLIENFFRYHKYQD